MSITITDANNLGNVVNNVYQYVEKEVEVEDEDGNTKTETKQVPSGGLEVINNKGTVLPSTGGIGTTIFYVVGGLLVVGAGVLLVTKKRVSDDG